MGYLKNVVEKKLPRNNQILFNLQEIFNLLPDISSDSKIKAFLTKNNDTTFVIYVCSIIRAITSLHNLIDNRIMNKLRRRRDWSVWRKNRRSQRNWRRRNKKSKTKQKREIRNDSCMYIHQCIT